MRPRRLVLLGVLAVVAAAIVVFWPAIDAQRRAVILFSSTTSTPVLSWVVRVVTAEPQAEETVVAGTPTTLVRTGHSRRHTVILLPGAGGGGRADPTVQRAARGLARAGYAVFVPELPGLADGEISERTVRAAIDVALEIAHRDDVSGGQVALAGAWAGAGIALLAAEDPLLAPRIDVVAAVAPWTAGPNLMRLATTGYSLDGSELGLYETDPYLGLVLARSLVAALEPSTARAQLLQLLHTVHRDDPDPLRIVRGLNLSLLPPDAAALVRLLANRRYAAFDRLYAALPDSLHAAIEHLSPLVGAAQLEARVELATAPDDRFVPPSESRALERASGRVHLAVTGAVRSGLPSPSIGDAFSANGFVVRALRAAS